MELERVFRRVTYLTETRFFRTLSLPVSRVIAFNNRQVFFDGFTTAEREERYPHCPSFCDCAFLHDNTCKIY